MVALNRDKGRGAHASDATRTRIGNLRSTLPTSILAACLSASACDSCHGCGTNGTRMAPGELSVELVDGKVDVLAHEVPLQRLLQQLAKAAEFQLTLHEELENRLTLSRERAAISPLLAELLRGHRYSLHYRAEPSATGTPSALVVGDEQTQQQRCSAETPVVMATAVALDPPGDLLDDAPSPQAALPSRTAMYDLAALQDEEPALRAAAVRATPPLGSGRDRLRGALAKDPDPGVRASAARQLGAGDDYATTSALLAALDDSEAVVVKGAIEALADLGDPSVVPALQEALDDHPDPDVQRALRLASARLQQGARRDPELPSMFEYQRPAQVDQAAAAPEQTAEHSQAAVSAR